MINLDQIAGFDWDDGNRRKSVDKHDVSQAEAESVFFNNPLIVVENAKHSEQELRLNALGKTAEIACCISPSPSGRMEQWSG